jgi:hypothetical protein
MPDERNDTGYLPVENQDEGRDLAQDVLGKDQPLGDFSRDTRGDTEPEPRPRREERREEPRPDQPPLTLDAYMSEREARQKAEGESKAWRDWYAKMTESQRAPAPPEIDPYVQPAEYMDQRQKVIETEVQKRMEEALQPIRSGLTQMWARNCFDEAKRQYGDKEAEQAYQEFDKGQMPRHEFEQVMRQPNPFAAAVLWKRRRDAVAAMGDDPAGFRERLRQEIIAEMKGLPPPREEPNREFEPPRDYQPDQPRNSAGQFQSRVPNLPSVNRTGASSPPPQALRMDQSDADLAQEILDAPFPRRG